MVLDSLFKSNTEAIKIVAGLVCRDGLLTFVLQFGGGPWLMQFLSYSSKFISVYLKWLMERELGMHLSILLNSENLNLNTSNLQRKSLQNFYSYQLFIFPLIFHFMFLCAHFHFFQAVKFIGLWQNFFNRFFQSSNTYNGEFLKENPW